jgi:hypothetical protein
MTVQFCLSAGDGLCWASSSHSEELTCAGAGNIRTCAHYDIFQALQGYRPLLAADGGIERRARFDLLLNTGTPSRLSMSVWPARSSIALFGPHPLILPDQGVGGCAFSPTAI